MFGVFDGHSGDACSKHCVRSLHKHLQQQLAQGLQQQADAVNDDVVHEALVQAFQKTDADIREMPLVSSSGSTATVALITDKSIHIAWAGDSRAVLLGGGRTLAHTIDHRADREDEQERVTALGGRVFFNSGMRVMGVLATTRAIGDHDLQPFGVVPTPEVISVPRNEEQEFLVLASDGLWDVMTHEEVFDYAHKTLLKVQQKHATQSVQHRVCSACQAAGIAARALALCARKQRHSRDDITVLLVNLSTPCTCAHPLGAHNVSSSSLMSKATAALVRTQGILGSVSADQLQRVGSGTRQRSSQLESQQHQHSTSSQSLPQLEVQQQLSRTTAGSGFAGGLLMQPSVRPGSAATPHAKAQQTSAGAARVGQVSDLVLSSPFASTVGSRPAAAAAISGVAAALRGGAAALPTDGATSSVLRSSLSGPGCAPASASSADDTSSEEEFIMDCTSARPVGSAPADLQGGVVAGALQQSLSLALGGNRSCGLVNTGSLGSSELPVAVLT
jgi:protein phosphatase 2C